MARFKYGDYVQANGYKAKVISIWSNHNGDYICRVRFTDGSEQEYPEIHLKPAVINKPTSCVPPSSARPAKSMTMSGTAKVTLNGRDIALPDSIDLTIKVPKNFKKYDNDETCPLCGDPWHWIPSPFRGMKEIWYDCTRCNLSRKDIKKKLESKDDEF